VDIYIIDTVSAVLSAVNRTHPNDVRRRASKLTIPSLKGVPALLELLAMVCPGKTSTAMVSSAYRECMPRIDSMFASGTHVAGIAASKTYGVAKKSNIIAVKVNRSPVYP
jgi:hypothetical protein